MSLRVRLIVAFFFFSVVPLAAVTYYSYTSNERALQVAAQHETEMLTSDLTQRMQVVTTQIGERVEHLMDMTPVTTAARSTPATPTTGATTRTPTTPTPSASPAARAAPANIDPTSIEGQVAGALGEVAMLLNNVEVRGLGRGRQAFPGGGGSGSPGQRTVTGRSGEPPSGAGTTGSETGRGSATGSEVVAGGGAGATGGTGASGAAGSGQPTRPPGGRSRPPRSGGGAEQGAPQGRVPTAPGETAAEPNQLKIDLTPIRRELFREMAPSGSFEKMTPEERQRVGREVNQRLLGIVQGIQMGAAELQKKAAEAQRQAAEAAAATSALAPGGASGTAPPPVPPPPTTGAAPPRPPAAVKEPPPVPATPIPKPTAAPAVTPIVPTPPSAQAAPLTRTAALTGTRLDVKFEQNGHVVQQVNAELNLPNLLATVFASTRRDSGEIPFAVGKDGHLYAPTDADREKLATLDVARVDDTPGTRRIGNWIVVTMPDHSGAGLRFGIARPVGNLLTELRLTTARNAGFGLLFIGVALVAIVPLSGRLTRNLSFLTDGVGRIARGDYGTRVPVKSHDEIGRLAEAFNKMAADVEKHQRAAVEQERIRRELELGRRIQFDMLPHSPLRLGLTEVKGASVPAREVGGDFFNYFELATGEIALLVGDVSGKGVGAALLMANIQASLRTRFALGQDLSSIAEAIDHDIEENSPGPVYATLFMGIFDPVARRLRYVNAGHNPQFVLRARGGLEQMPSTGLPVGMIAGRGYTEIQIQLAAGDLLFFYTDGCTETENESGEMFGMERLEQLVSSTARESADQVLATVEQAITSFRGGKELFDDATMMAVTVG